MTKDRALEIGRLLFRHGGGNWGLYGHISDTFEELMNNGKIDQPLPPSIMEVASQIGLAEEEFRQWGVYEVQDFRDNPPKPMDIRLCWTGRKY